MSAASTNEPPKPPTSSAKGTASQPSSPIWAQVEPSQPVSSSRSLRKREMGDCFCAKSVTVRLSIC